MLSEIHTHWPPSDHGVRALHVVCAHARMPVVPLQGDEVLVIGSLWSSVYTLISFALSLLRVFRCELCMVPRLACPLLSGVAHVWADYWWDWLRSGGVV